MRLFDVSGGKDEKVVSAGLIRDADDEDDDVEGEQLDVDGAAEAAEVSADDRAAGDPVAGPDEGDEEASD